MSETENIPDICLNCWAKEQSLISEKSGKRCRHASPVNYSYKKQKGICLLSPSYVAVWNGCNLRVVAKCGHELDMFKYPGGDAWIGKCTGAENCPDFEPMLEPATGGNSLKRALRNLGLWP